MVSNRAFDKKRQRSVTRMCLLGAVALHVGFFIIFFEKIVSPPDLPRILLGRDFEPPPVEKNTIKPVVPETVWKPPLADITSQFRPGSPAPINDFPQNPNLPPGDYVIIDPDAPTPLPLPAETKPLSPIGLVLQLATRFLPVGIGQGSEEKNQVFGQKRRASGQVTLGILDLPGEGSLDGQTDRLWSNGELENISEFISQNTKVRVSLGSRAISFVGPNASFDAWVRKAQQRVLSDYRPLSTDDPEISALDQLASACPFASEKQYEVFRNRVRRVLVDYFRARFGVMLNPEDSGWTRRIETYTIIDPWQREYLTEAEHPIRTLLSERIPTVENIRSFYLYLRMEEIQKLWILLCETPGVPSTLHPENIRMLTTYVHSRGFIYFTNTSGYLMCMGVRSLIGELIQEKIADPLGEQTLERLRQLDRSVSGYEFRPPEPAIFHPFTFFPMIIPRHTKVTLTIFNRSGDTIFTEELDRYPGAYVQRNKHYRWYTQDMQGNPVGPGYYIYQIDADLFRQTGPMLVSKLTLLPNRKHPIFSSYFAIDEVPTAVSPKPEDLPYGEAGVYGYSVKGRQAICYTEGYREKEWLKNRGTKDARQGASLRWVTNVLFHALSERATVL